MENVFRFSILICRQEEQKRFHFFGSVTRKLLRLRCTRYFKTTFSLSFFTTACKIMFRTIRRVTEFSFAFSFHGHLERKVETKGRKERVVIKDRLQGNLILQVGARRCSYFEFNYFKS